MLGARGASHLAADEHVVIKLDEPGHPLLRPSPARTSSTATSSSVFTPYSRDRVRGPPQHRREKSAIAGRRPPRHACRTTTTPWPGCGTTAGAGSSTPPSPTIPTSFWDPKMLRVLPGATQFALGDLPAPTLPSGRLTPALRAQEKLGWRLGVEAYTFHKYTFFEAIDKTAELGLPYLGGLSFQKVSDEIPKNLDPATHRRRDRPGPAETGRRRHPAADLLHPEHPRRRGRLPEGLRVRPQARRSRSSCQRARAGVPRTRSNGSATSTTSSVAPAQPRPEGLARLLVARGDPARSARAAAQRIGACADLGYWMRAGHRSGRRHRTAQGPPDHPADARPERA